MLDFLVAGPVDRRDVEVLAVLDRLLLGHGDEQQPRLAVRPDQAGLLVLGLVRVVRMVVVLLEHLAPELLSVWKNKLREYDDPFDGGRRSFPYVEVESATGVTYTEALQRAIFPLETL